MKNKNHYSISRRGFTLIELLIVIAIIGILASIVTVSLSGARQKSMTAKDTSQLRMIATALEAYHTQFQSYPVSSGWQGFCSAWGASLGANWIPELQTSGITSGTTLPVDARQGSSASCVDNQQQYIYVSDGTNYKLISVSHSSVANVPAALIDPTRPTTAYGFWSNGAASW